MATYTMTMQELVTQPSQNSPELTMKQRIEWGRAVLFNDMDYPFFNERYKREFETHLIRHFFTREIGYETEWLFKFKLETWLQINMPYYNQLFESELIKYDPLSNINMKVSQDTTKDTTQDTKQDTTQDTTGDSTTQSSFDHTGSEQTGETVTGEQDTANHNTSVNNTTVAGTEDTVTENSGTNDQTVTGNSTTQTDGQSDTTTDSDTNTDTFNRKIESDTPNERLRLSSEDGHGVIEYASGIDETKDIGTTNTHTSTNTTDSNTTAIDSTETTAGTTSENGSTNTTRSDQTDSTTTDDGTQNTTHSQNTDRDTDTEKSGWDHSRTDTNDNMVGSLIGNVKGNELENYINQRNGKEGTVTYQQMIQELRQTFLRIERDIFNEMNNELFMLVY